MTESKKKISQQHSSIVNILVLDKRSITILKLCTNNPFLSKIN